MKIPAIIGHLWQRAESVSIRTKIMGIVVFLLLFLGVGITIQTSNNLKKLLVLQLEERALSIARDLSGDLGGLMISGQLSALAAKVDNTANNNADINYIIINDNNGNVVYQFPYPAGPSRIQDFPEGVEYKDGAYKARSRGVIDIAVPMLGMPGGFVRVGITEGSINREVWVYVRRSLMLTGILSLSGFLATFYLTHVLTRPMKELVEVTRAVSRGDLGVRARVRTEDDIGKLGKSFNSMIVELEKSGKDRQSLWNELKKREEMRGQLLERVIKAQEEERKRIARELHDETSQSMASLMVGLKMLEQDGYSTEKKQRIKELRDLASEAMNKVHGLAIELRPSSLDDLGLLPAMEQYTIDFAKRYGIKVDFQAIGFNERRMPPEKETALYRIVQEALTNVAKHSQASIAGVILEFRNSSVKAIVEDNGRGFEAEKIMSTRDDERGLGLLGMLERATLLGGKLSVESDPGKGTTVFVEIPVINFWKHE